MGNEFENFTISPELNSLIEATVKNVAGKMVSDMKENIMKDNDERGTFGKTESLLYHYPNLKNAIIIRQEEYDEIQKYGLRKKSNSVTSYYGNLGYIDVKSEYEKKEEKLNRIKETINDISERIGYVEKALDKVSSDPYFDLIRLKYFEGKTQEQIAKYFKVDVSTVKRNKNRLIKELEISLFGDEHLKTMLSWLVV